jgi:pyridoxamine 5'-phosphate oxidase
MKKDDYFDGHNNEPQCPFTLFREWLALAESAEPSYATAMALASVTEQNRPNVRIVLMRRLDENGLYFYTNYESDKGRALIANPYAEANFYWKSLEKQVRFHGAVVKTSPEESDSYFNGRPRESRIGAWASQQSRPMNDYGDLERAINEYTQKFEGTENPPRPEHWGGFKIVPERIEFWAEQPYRLHKRFVFIKNPQNGAWDKSWLYP